MPHVRIALGAFLVGTFVSGCGGPSIPEGSTRVVNVLGSSTRVMTLGLEDREPGEPVLILFAGGGAPMESWGKWISTVSSLAPVVTYDRPGIGESPFDGIDPTPERVVAHAHELLNVLDVPPPYVLVGHSWGGPLIRYYAGEFPEDIVGMVYLDPTDMEASAAEAIGASNEEELRERQAELDAVRAERSVPPGREAEMRVTTEFLRAPVADRGLPDDPSVPTIVVLGTLAPDISAGAPSYVDERWFEALFAGRISRFTEWAQDRPNRTLLVSSDAGHFVHLDDPDMAMEAVRRVVGEVGSGP